MAKTKDQQQQALSQNAAGRYFKEVRSEMSKVVWPSREQTTNLTLIVLAVMILMGAFLGLTDYIFGALVQLLITTLG